MFPGFTANLAFELWVNNNEEYYVKVSYNGTYWPICDGECTFKEFE